MLPELRLQEISAIGERLWLAKPASSQEKPNAYGTGCLMLIDTGEKPVRSNFGLLTTVAYKFGAKPACYALEGSIAITGALVQWLRDNLGLIEKSSDIEALARTVDDNGGVYFVPAFSGLYAPYWKDDARGVIAGLTRFVNKGHIARAVLEATGVQVREVVDAMKKELRRGQLWRPWSGGARRRGNGRERSADAIPVRHSGEAGGSSASD